MTEVARRVTATRQPCAVHGFAFVVFDLGEGWRCMGEREHYKIAEGKPTEAMLRDFARLGIDPEEDETP